MKLRNIYLIMALLTGVISYGQVEAHVYKNYAVGTTDDILDKEPQYTYSTVVVDWDNYVLTLDGISMEIGRYVELLDEGMKRFNVEREGDVMAVLLGKSFIIIKDRGEEAIMFIK